VRFKQYLEREGLLDEKADRDIRERCTAEIEAAVQEAEKVGPPGASTLFEDVFAEKTAQLAEQSDALRDALQRGAVSRGHHGEFPL